MASTPKAIRRTAKRIGRETSNYFGFPVHSQVNIGAKNASRTRKRGGYPKSKITIDRQLLQDGKTSMQKVRKILRHEFFHVAGDSYLLGKVSMAADIPGEAIAMVANAEHEIKESTDQRIHHKYLIHQERRLLTEPPANPLHLAALRIMVNILREFPDKQKRKIFIRELLEHNAKAIKEAREKNSDLTLMDKFGRLFPE
ncbi:Uncharacterised protein [uncultured archaeon]|nr:Uncharacterised protein [uncultured archaeon]